MHFGVGFYASHFQNQQSFNVTLLAFCRKARDFARPAKRGRQSDRGDPDTARDPRAVEGSPSERLTPEFKGVEQNHEP